jgi:phage gp36-like protein
MMSDYIDVADAQERLRDNLQALYELPAESVHLDNDLTGVEAIVDSSVGKRYVVPITNTTALTVIRVLCLDLFEERAWRRGHGDAIPEKVKTQADEARKMLENIAKGAITLAGATALTERQSGGADAIVVDGNEPEFKRDDMQGF